MDKGYVYILVNKSMPGLIKIGQTTKKPEERAKELSSPTGVAAPFEVAYALCSSQYESLEKRMHTALAKHRTNNNREFFEVSVDEAKTLLNKFASPIERILNFSWNIFPFRQQHTRGNTSIGHSQGKPIIAPTGELMIEPGGGTPKLGVNGKPYYSSDNGFYQAKNANGIPESVRDHINIIIDNEELAINTDHEFLKEKIKALSDEIKNLEQKGGETEKSVIENQMVLSDNKLLLDKLNAVEDLEKSIDDKNNELNNKKTILARLQVDLSEPPSDDRASQPPSLRLYRLFGVFCVILSFALYFFYISAIDKGYLSNLPTPSESQDIDPERYTQLNDIFDPSSIVRAFQEANLWLIAFPFFALGLALVIHPLLTYGRKYWREGKQKAATTACWFGVFMFVVVTFIFDCILALQVSKKIHEAKVLFGLEEGDWPIKPLQPMTWDLNIYLVLFCGFLVSFLLSVLFHFTLEMWKEARTQDVDDRIRTKKKIRSLETKLRGQEDTISVMANKLESARKELKNQYNEDGSTLEAAEIRNCKSNIELLTARISKDNSRVKSIQEEIKQKQDEIEDAKDLIAKKAIDIVKLKSNVSEFVSGWTKFLAAAKDDAAMDVETVQQIAESTLRKYLEV